ncbi:MAG: gamma carbonic anhydrase family protein [Chloroflexota bacterium]
MIYKLGEKVPKIAENVFIAPNATIIGDVVIEEGASIWFGAVLRGDTGQIRIGAGSSVQDNCVIHVNVEHDTVVGAGVTLGHGVIAEGCFIGDNCLIGMNATVLDGSTVESGSLIAAGAVVRENQVIPSGSLAGGVPAKIIRPLTAEAVERIQYASVQYRKYGQQFRQDLQQIENIH